MLLFNVFLYFFFSILFGVFYIVDFGFLGGDDVYKRYGLLFDIFGVRVINSNFFLFGVSFFISDIEKDGGFFYVKLKVIFVVGGCFLFFILFDVYQGLLLDGCYILVMFKV